MSGIIGLHPTIVSAENNTRYSLTDSSDLPPEQKHSTQRSKLRLRTGEKGRDLQSTEQENLAKAISNGLRMPFATKQKTSAVSSPALSVEPMRLNIVKTGIGSGMTTRGGSANNNKNKNRNSNKNRTSKRKRVSRQNKKRNSRASINTKKRTSSASKNRGGSRNYKQGSNNKKKRQSGSKKTHQSANNMTQRTSSASSFLKGINQVVGDNRGYSKIKSYGGYGSGKPVKYIPPPPSTSAWGGSSHLVDSIIWDGGVHTNQGVAGVLEPCPCVTPWGSSAHGKSGKASSAKCLCLVAAALPVMPTYYPTYFPTYVPTYFPTYTPTYFPTSE